MKGFRPFGLHGTVLVLASTHFVVDGYGNVLTPLLPLLITDLNLSLAGAGTLQMCFQLANSVAQLGFGQVADRSNPRILLIGGPLLAVGILPLVGLAPTVWVLAAVLILGGLAARLFIRRRRRSSTGTPVTIAASRCRFTSQAAHWARPWPRSSSRHSSSDSGCPPHRGW